MPRNDEGEFELILGNRQLVSVFLIVVILLGVFFSMGYILGRNSAPSETAKSASSKPIVVETPPQSPGSSSSAPAPETPAAPLKPAPSSTPPDDAKLDQPKARPKPPDIDAAKPPEHGPIGAPPPGNYLQVIATTRADAEFLADRLVKKGFHALVAPGPDSARFRVVIGPAKDAADLAETRSRLEHEDFKPIVRKY